MSEKPTGPNPKLYAQMCKPFDEEHELQQEPCKQPRIGGHWTLPDGIDAPTMTPEQQQRFQIYLDWFALGLARAVAIEHTLFWGRLKVQQGPHEPQDAFALFVVGTATANRAHELLLSLPLCTTDLGEVPPRRYGASVTDRASKEPA